MIFAMSCPWKTEDNNTQFTYRVVTKRRSKSVREQGSGFHDGLQLLHERLLQQVIHLPWWCGTLLFPSQLFSLDPHTYLIYNKCSYHTQTHFLQLENLSKKFSNHLRYQSYKATSAIVDAYQFGQATRSGYQNLRLVVSQLLNLVPNIHSPDERHNPILGAGE